MDAIVKSSSTRRRKKDGIDLEQMADQEIEDMRRRMAQAAEADNEGRKRGEPARHKLKLLPEVVALLNKSNLKESIVDPESNILEAVRFFLEPLSDGSLPAYDIQKELFAALGKLPINKDTLVASGIGKVIMFYIKSKRPELIIKRQAERLFTDWTRPILRRTDDYRKKEFAQADYDPTYVTYSLLYSPKLTLSQPQDRTRQHSRQQPGRGPRSRKEARPRSPPRLPARPHGSWPHHLHNRPQEQRPVQRKQSESLKQHRHYAADTRRPEWRQALSFVMCQAESSQLVLHLLARITTTIHTHPHIVLSLFLGRRAFWRRKHALFCGSDDGALDSGIENSKTSCFGGRASFGAVTPRGYSSLSLLPCFCIFAGGENDDDNDDDVGCIA